MKKLKLKALELGAKEVLTRAQLKNVLGGDGSGGGSGGGGTGCYTCTCTVIEHEEFLWTSISYSDAFQQCSTFCGQLCLIPIVNGC